jgi:lipoprotein-anchoring transpeptidase ErfK/SrfK
MAVAAVSPVKRVQQPQDVDGPGPLQTKAFSTNPLLRKIAAGGRDETGAPMSIGKRTRPPIPADPTRPPNKEGEPNKAGETYDAIENAADPAAFKKAAAGIGELPEDQRGVLNQKLEHEVGTAVDNATTPGQLKNAQELIDTLPADKKATWQGVLADRPRQIEIEKANEIAQTAMFSLGKDVLPNGPYMTRDGIDGRFGPKMESTLKAMQGAMGVPVTGRLDAKTIQAMDQRGKAQIEQLKQQSRPQDAAKVVVDMVDKQNTRMYLLDKQGQMLAGYDVSPGTDRFPTKGDVLKTSDAMVRTPWNNGGAAWSKSMPAQIPPGVNNPMGMLKFPIDNNGQYIHDIPGREDGQLGRVASHGCIRLGTGIYEARERYGLRGGLPVVLARDAATRSREMAGANPYGGPPNIRSHDAGREYLFGYMSGELGGPQVARR